MERRPPDLLFFLSAECGAGGSGLFVSELVAIAGIPVCSLDDVELVELVLSLFVVERYADCSPI